MALVSVEFVGHHRIGGRLTNRLDAKDPSIVARLTDRGLVVEEGDMVRTIPWAGILAVVEKREAGKERVVSGPVATLEAGVSVDLSGKKGGKG